METGAIYTDDFVLHDTGRIEAKVRYPPDNIVPSTSGFVVGRQQGIQVDLGTLRMWLSVGSFFVSAYEMGMELVWNVNIGEVNQNTWYHPSIATINGQIIFFRNRDSANAFNVDFPGDFFVTLGHLSGSDAGQTGIQDLDVDFVLRRGYAAVEPDYMIGVEENL
jgi:hypothetical protein